MRQLKHSRRSNKGNVIHMTFYRVPVPKQGDKSRIATLKTGKQFIHHYQPSQVVNEHAALALLAQENRPDELWDCAIAAELHYYFSWPKSISKKRKAAWIENHVCDRATKPDGDNLEKMIWDALEGVIFINDSRITRLHRTKSYSDTPRIEITLSKIERT